MMGVVKFFLWILLITFITHLLERKVSNTTEHIMTAVVETANTADALLPEETIEIAEALIAEVPVEMWTEAADRLNELAVKDSFKIEGENISLIIKSPRRNNEDSMNTTQKIY